MCRSSDAPGESGRADLLECAPSGWRRSADDGHAKPRRHHVVCYLYAEDVLGNGQLISHKPYTLRGATPGQAKTIDLRLEASSWEVPAGSRLTLVVDTVDLRYAGISQLGGTVTFSSPANAPSVLKLPLH